MKFRELRADEIDCRIAQVKENGLSLLLYKDARVDQNILDETVGTLNWQRSHELIGANLYCTVSIWDEDKKQWISKQDVGTESFTEKEKGQASDSFKRACFNLGIGRELYTAPFIWIKATDCKITSANGKSKCFDNFTVSKIGYKDGRITSLEIRNEALNRVVYTMGKKAEKSPEVTPDSTEYATDAQRTEIAVRARKLGKDPIEIFNKAGGETGQTMTKELYDKCSIILDEISATKEGE